VTTAQDTSPRRRINSYISAFSDAQSSTPPDSPQTPGDVIRQKIGPDRQLSFQVSSSTGQDFHSRTSGMPVPAQPCEPSECLPNTGRRVKHLSNGVFTDEDFGLGVTSTLTISPSAHVFLVGDDELEPFPEYFDTNYLLEWAVIEQANPLPVSRQAITPAPLSATRKFMAKFIHQEFDQLD
jgi:hypothetical protein